jgi:hypothetical protein
MDRMHKIVLLAGGLILLYFLAAPRRLGPMSREQALAAFVILLAIVNAVTVGALSAPIARLQARVVWVIPAVAFMLVWRRVTAQSIRSGVYGASTISPSTRST